MTMTTMWGDGVAPILQAVEFPLADGGMPDVGKQRNLCLKFSTKGQQEMALRLVEEIHNGALYRGDWKKGEIEIIALVQIIACRFWLEAVYDVWFVPKNGTEPVRGSYRNLVWVSGVDSGAGALCITKGGNIALVRCFRHSVRRWCLELPRGNRLPDEDLETCALREAREEVGAETTASTKVVDLGIIDADNGAIRQEPRIVAITDVVLTGRANRDVSESVMTTLVVTPAEFLSMVASGEITCGWAMSAVMKAVAHELISL